ncbi:hypothetical protein pb186bvf_005632 [Paramecium bursaria]
MNNAAFRNSRPQRKYRERSQPIKREHMGLLEKHQDYKKRATNFQRKRDQLQKLQLKAALKNKDEFNFRMVKGKLKDDRHVDRDEDGEDKDKIMYEVRTQNQNLLKAAISRKEKLCEKLQEDLCLIRYEKPTHTFFVTHSNQISKIEKDPDYEVEKTPTIHRKIEKLKQESKEKERLKGFLVAVTKAKQKFKGKNHQKKKIKKNPMRGLRERQ